MIKVISGVGAVASIITGNLPIAVIFAVILVFALTDDAPHDDEESGGEKG